MPTPPIRWPNNAEQARKETQTIAEEAEGLILEAIEDIRSNPSRCELRLVYAARQLAHIRRLMTEAKVGR